MLLSKIEIKDINYIHKKARHEFEKLSNNRIIITGGAGFLGYYFVKSILCWNDININKKIQLFVYDNFKTGIPTWMLTLKNRSDLKLIKKDITKLKFSKTEHFDYIIHAASIASPVYYRLYPIETIDANINGLRNLLKYMVANKKSGRPVKSMLFFSSSEIYGDPSQEYIPTPEIYRGNVSCTGPRACYDESKRFGETLCVNYVNVHNLPIKIVRPFNNYGPGLKLNDGRVIADFAKNIINDMDIIMFSNGAPTRTFCYVADAIVGYLKVLINGKQGEAYNIGTKNPEISMKNLANRMTKIARKYFNYKGNVIIKQNKDKDYLIDSPNRRCPLINKAVNEVGYNPEFLLDEGLYQTLEWFAENYKQKRTIPL